MKESVTISLARTILFLIGAGLLLAGLFIASRNLFMLATNTQVVGIISYIDVKIVKGKSGGTFYHYYVTYPTREGKMHSAAITGGIYSPYAKGESVMVYYDPEHPEQAILNSFPTLWVAPTILIILGGVLTSAVFPFRRVFSERRVKNDGF